MKMIEVARAAKPYASLFFKKKEKKDPHPSL